jgi:hypothetical protein
MGFQQFRFRSSITTNEERRFGHLRCAELALRARQLSKRGGELLCEDRGERVGIGGNAVTYVEGKLHTS